MTENVFVLLSGGQDSTTTLYWAKSIYRNVYACTLDYGQRHIAELQAAAKIAKMARVKHHIVLPCDTFSVLADSAMFTNADISAVMPHNNLPASFVPGRNMLLLTLLGAYAYKMQREGPLNLVIGACQTDYCLAGDTPIETLRDLSKYPRGVPIRELVGKTPLVWAYDLATEKYVLRRARNVRWTKKDETVRVTYRWHVPRIGWKQATIRCTPDHRFLLRDGTYKQAQHLSENESLMPFGESWENGYRRVYRRVQEWEYEHKLAYEQYHGIRMSKKRFTEVVHHVDHNRMNNRIKNLERMDYGEHRARHQLELSEEKREIQRQRMLKTNPMQNAESREKVRQAKLAYWNGPNNHKVVSVVDAGVTDVFDLEVPGVQNFASNGVIVHNSGYPDCRDDFVRTCGIALAHALDRQVFVHAPLMHKTKAETVKMARRFPGCWEALAYSITCYEGHEQGGCDACPACVLRAKGFKEAGFEDPAKQRAL